MNPDSRPTRHRSDRATGVFGTTFGFLVFLMFLLFSVQLLFGLYVRTTVTAVATDLAQRAANEGSSLDAARFAAYESEARRRLGRYGDDADFTVSLADVDLDGVDDTVRVHVDAALPTMLPTRWAPLSPSFERTMSARLEVFQR